MATTTSPTASTHMATADVTTTALIMPIAKDRSTVKATSQDMALSVATDNVRVVLCCGHGTAHSYVYRYGYGCDKKMAMVTAMAIVRAMAVPSI